MAVALVHPLAQQKIDCQQKQDQNTGLDEYARRVITEALPNVIHNCYEIID